MTTFGAIRKHFRQHTGPHGRSLRTLSAEIREEGLLPVPEIERPEQFLLEELYLEAVPPLQLALESLRSLPCLAQHVDEIPRDGRFDVRGAFPPPLPPNGEELLEALQELGRRYGSAGGRPPRKAELAIGGHQLEVEDAAATWAARRAREALLGADTGVEIALPAARGNAPREEPWKVVDTMTVSELRSVVDRLREAEAELVRRQEELLSGNGS